MESRRYRPDQQRSLWLSPFLLAAVLMPALLQVQYTCETEDATLASLEVEVSGYDQIDGFAPATKQYEATVSADSVVLRALAQDPASSVYYQLRKGGALLAAGALGVGGGEVTLAIPVGHLDLKVEVRPPQGGFGFYDVDIDRLPKFDCTEQGILDAIAVGGGPHTFDCNGPTVVTTLAEILIDNDVVLDGEGNLTLESVFPYPQVLLTVVTGVTSELVGLRLVHYPGDLLPIQTIQNEGSLSLTDCIIEPGDYSHSHGTAIYSDGSLTLSGTALLGSHSAFGHCPGIESFGSLTLVASTVSDIGAPDGHAVCSSGSLLMIGSAVIDSVTVGGAIHSGGDATLVNSTVSGNTYAANTNAVAAGGTLTLINSTIAFSGRGVWTLSNEEGGPEPTDLFATNSIIVGPGSAVPPRAACIGLNTFSGGGNIESPGDTCGLTDPTDLVNVTAEELNLGPLADNGGPTETHALLPGSVAIDHVPASMCLDENGDPLTTDQRGVPRPQGAACDVGAFEWADCAGSCDDGNECTADYCDPSDDSWCVNNPLPDGAACDFGGLPGVCIAGLCEEDLGV